MSNLSRNHLASRRAERGPFAGLVTAVVALCVATAVGLVVIDLYAGLATAIGDAISITRP